MKNIMEEMNKYKVEQAQPLSNLEKLQKQADFFNEEKGDMDELDCPICKNKGFIQRVVFEDFYKDYVLVASYCECMSKRKTIQKAKKSGLGDYINKRFKDFEDVQPYQKQMKQKAVEFVKEENNKWFIALGQSGSGKTLISCIIANYLLLKQNKDVIYITWTDFISKLKRDMMSDNSDSVSDYLDQIKKVDVLFIDEMLKKYNETDLKYLIEIINYRYTNDLKTIITSERVIDELIDIDESVFSRMVEKAEQYIINIPKDRTKNYRLKGIYGNN